MLFKPGLECPPHVYSREFTSLSSNTKDLKNGLRRLSAWHSTTGVMGKIKRKAECALSQPKFALAPVIRCSL